MNNCEYVSQLTGKQCISIQTCVGKVFTVFTDSCFARKRSSYDQTNATSYCFYFPPQNIEEVQLTRHSSAELTAEKGQTSLKAKH